MNNDMEGFWKGLQKYLDENKAESEEDVNRLSHEYIQKYNASLTERKALSEDTAESSDDWLDLAEDAENPKTAVRYARKALELNPDNLDAQTLLGMLLGKNPFEQYQAVCKACENGKRLMEKEGFLPQSKGDFWQLLGTRPYIRTLISKMELEEHIGLTVEAEKTGEYIMELNKMDNNGIRFDLMCLYADLLQKDKAEKLLKKSEDHGYEDGSCLLAITLLYYRLNEWDHAEETLMRLWKSNKDTKKFFDGVCKGKLKQFEDSLDDIGYRPFTIEELTTTVTENWKIYGRYQSFFFWGNEALKKRYKKNKG